MEQWKKDVLFHKPEAWNFILKDSRSERQARVYLQGAWRGRIPGAGRGGRLDGRMQCWVPANNRRAFQRLLRLLPLCWYARNASCQQMLLTHDDALGIRMDAASILTSGPKGIIVGLIPCPWDGILLFIETMQNYCLLANLLNIASASRTRRHLVQGFKKLSLVYNCSSLHNWRQAGRTMPIHSCGPKRVDKTVLLVTQGNSMTVRSLVYTHNMSPVYLFFFTVYFSWYMFIGELFGPRSTCSQWSKTTNDDCGQ